MRKLFFASLMVVLFSSGVNAQMQKEAVWKYSLSTPPRAGQEIELVFTATIPAGWLMYSNDFDPDLGPMITTFTFTPHASYKLVGKPVPVNPKRKHDEVFEGEVSYFSGKAEFRQKVKILSSNPVIKGEIEYQICNEKDGLCVMFYPEFEFKPQTAKAK
jgi:hypothetical protein